MAERGNRWLRLPLALGFVLLSLIELQLVAYLFSSQRRTTERVTRNVTRAALSARGPARQALASGGPTAWDGALRAALERVPDAEAELFDPSGKPLAASPHAAPVEHWLTPEQFAGLSMGTVLVVGPRSAPLGRMLAYAKLRSGSDGVVLRLAVPVPDLVEDLEEKRRLLVIHGAALLLLLVAAAVAGLPSRRSAEGASADPYVEAMERLRARGDALREQHQAEMQQLERSLQDKEAMARAGELTAGIVHEVRNGVGTILGYARLIESQAPPAAILDAAGQIAEECGTLDVVIRRFSEFIREETLQSAPFDLGRLLERVCARESRGRPGGECVIESSEALEIVADEALLERAFENLVRNARDASGAGGRVWVRWWREDRQARVSICDEGPGMTVAARENVRPFYTTKPGGLGLGLPLAVKLVQLHGGSLRLLDREPRGICALVSIEWLTARDATDGNVE